MRISFGGVVLGLLGAAVLCISTVEMVYIYAHALCLFVSLARSLARSRALSLSISHKHAHQGVIEAPVVLTARWTNDYESLLNREATTLSGVDVNSADAPGGVEQADSSVLASARQEQDEYMKGKQAAALQQAKDIVSMAKETNTKFGGTFSDGVGSNTWAGTPYAKYDDKDRRTESLKMMMGSGSRDARMEILALTAARVRADRKAALEAANKQARISALKAKKACHGSSQCESVLNQVMGIFGQPAVGK